MMEKQEVNLPSHFKQLKICTKYMIQWFTRHWTSGNEGKRYLNDRKQTKWSYDCPGSQSGKSFQDTAQRWEPRQSPVGA